MLNTADSAPTDEQDVLSLILRQIELKASVFLKADYCGRWAVDSSGSMFAPFHLITRGSGWLHLEGEEPTQLMGGELVLFPRDLNHKISFSSSPPDAAIVNQPPPDNLSGPVTGILCGHFEFDRDAALPLLASLPDVVVLDLRDTATNRDTATVIQLWINEATTGLGGADFVIDQLAYVLFVHMLRIQIESGNMVGPLAAIADARLAPVLLAIHERPGSDHNIDALAVTAGMSRSAFAQYFRSKVGTTPGQYVINWRMQLATKLLKSTNLSIASISEQVGYSSEVAFRKAFRTATGTPPGRVRRQG